jgi:hypothetical protein
MGDAMARPPLDRYQAGRRSPLCRTGRWRGRSAEVFPTAGEFFVCLCENAGTPERWYELVLWDGRLSPGPVSPGKSREWQRAGSAGPRLHVLRSVVAMRIRRGDPPLLRETKMARGPVWGAAVQLGLGEWRLLSWAKAVDERGEARRDGRFTLRRYSELIPPCWDSSPV